MFFDKEGFRQVLKNNEEILRVRGCFMKLYIVPRQKKHGHSQDLNEDLCEWNWESQVPPEVVDKKADARLHRPFVNCVKGLGYYSQISKKPVKYLNGILWSDLVQGGDRIMGEDRDRLS